MSKTALLDALHRMDVDRVREILRAKPALREFRDEKGYNLLQICSKRLTKNDAALADRQVRMARWLVAIGFDPRIEYTTPPGDDGEESASNVSLALVCSRQSAEHQVGALHAGPGMLKLGADPNIPAHDKTTPLHTALKKEYFGAYEILLLYGASPDVPGSDGRTVREIASRKRDRRWLRALPQRSKD